MSEIERAIEHIEDNVRFLQTHDYADNSLQAHELALIALKEKLDREKNLLTCDGCANAESFSCNFCKRNPNRPDRYEPKGEKA